MNVSSYFFSVSDEINELITGQLNCVRDASKDLPEGPLMLLAPFYRVRDALKDLPEGPLILLAPPQ